MGRVRCYNVGQKPKALRAVETHGIRDENIVRGEGVILARLGGRWRAFFEEFAIVGTDKYYLTRALVRGALAASAAARSSG